jgi:hypothetical protein
MARAPSAFRQQDVTKVLKATVAAGLRVIVLKVDFHSGKIEVETGEPRAQDSVEARELNEWDSIS